MKVRAIILGRGISFTRGTLNGNMVTVGKKKKYFVSTLFPREKKTILSLGIRKKLWLYAVCMEGEPRTLAYMDNFQADSFDAFLTDTLEDLKANNGTSVEDVRKALWSWRGPDQVIDGMESEPCLKRKFRASPVTDEQLHMSITDSQRAKLMHGKQLGEWVFLIIGVIMGAIITGAAMYAGFIAPATAVNGGPPSEVLGGVILNGLRALGGLL